MLGLTSSGCFITGLVLGFILAAAVGLACVCYFNPEIKEQTIGRVEAFWGKVKDNVDSSIDAAKKAPTAEPQIGTSTPKTASSKEISPRRSSSGTTKGTAPADAGNSGGKAPKIEIKLNL